MYIQGFYCRNSHYCMQKLWKVNFDCWARYEGVLNVQKNLNINLFDIIISKYVILSTLTWWHCKRPRWKQHSTAIEFNKSQMTFIHNRAITFHYCAQYDLMRLVKICLAVIFFFVGKGSFYDTAIGLHAALQIVIFIAFNRRKSFCDFQYQAWSMRQYEAADFSPCTFGCIRTHISTR